jgi:transcriptional regulator with XRE-family HTH domain
MKIIIEVEVNGLGTALKQARESAHLSLAAAGNLAGMSAANFNRIENEEHKSVPLHTLVRAAQVVNLDLNELLGDWIYKIPGVELLNENS